MLRLIFTQDDIMRDGLIGALSLEKKADTPYHSTVYQKGEWILVYSKEKGIDNVIETLLEEYYPDRLYLPSLGRSIDHIHEIGDVILPNVFMCYDEALKDASLDKENRDTFVSDVEFLEIFQEQKDYYVEDFGLSIGGIVVDHVPTHASEELDEKLMMAYEADVYVSENMKNNVAILKNDTLPTIISVGITDGKKSKNHADNPLFTTVRNMVTTWRLMEEE